MRKYAIIDHPSDLKLRIWGKNTSELLGNAILALFDTMLEDNNKKRYGKEFMLIESGSIEDIIVNTLNDILSRFYIHKTTPERVSVKVKGNSAEIHIEEKPFSGKMKLEVKAITFSGINIKKTRNGLSLEVVLDV